MLDGFMVAGAPHRFFRCDQGIQIQHVKIVSLNLYNATFRSDLFKITDTFDLTDTIKLSGVRVQIEILI